MNKKIKLILFIVVFIIGIFMIPTLGQASSNVKSILQIVHRLILLETHMNNHKEGYWWQMKIKTIYHL